MEINTKCREFTFNSKGETVVSAVKIYRGPFEYFERFKFFDSCVARYNVELSEDKTTFKVYRFHSESGDELAYEYLLTTESLGD